MLAPLEKKNFATFFTEGGFIPPKFSGSHISHHLGNFFTAFVNSSHVSVQVIHS